LAMDGIRACAATTSLQPAGWELPGRQGAIGLLTSGMKVLSALVVVACLGCLCAAQNTCKCREIGSGDPCSYVVQDGDGTCVTKSDGCSGCICDNDGTLDCDIEDAKAYAFDLGGLAGECSLVDSIRTKCPDATPAPVVDPFQQTIGDSCNVTGPLSWNDEKCMMKCFPPSFGTLESMNLTFYTLFNGSYEITSTQEVSGFVSLQLRARVSVVHDTAFLFQGGDETFDVPATPSFASNGFSAGRVVEEDVFGELFLSGSPEDGINSYICSGSETEAEFVIDGEVRTLRQGDLQVSTNGRLEAYMTVEYTFSSSELNGTPLPS